MGYASGIVRLNSDGTIDETFIRPQILDENGFRVGIGPIGLDADGKILICGGFV